MDELRAEQIDFWDGTKGDRWANAQTFMDGMLKAFSEPLVKAVAAGPARAVLDVGCGNGATTLAMARVAAPDSQIAGIDISQAMLKNAMADASRAGIAIDYIYADAQDHTFGGGKYDLIVSRFGVMFFADPILAFRNLRGATADDGKLVLVVWREPEINPLLTVARKAAAPLLPELPTREPTWPGPFAFASPDHVRGVLTGSGWGDVELEPIDRDCTFPTDQLETYLGKLAPVGHDLDGMDDGLRAQVLDAVRKAYEPFIDGPDVRFKGCAWVVRAKAG
ncbi:MAG: class I SAM-dependent methyltransferase [Pseudomonadota bacterium]